jgi:hypothetical protein
LEGYEPRDVYNADETGLFFNALPDRTLAYKGETCHGGKHSKDRLTVLICVNSYGSDKQVLIVIGKSSKARCFKDFCSYVSVDRHVATSGISTDEELCGAYVSTRSVEEKNKEDQNEQDMVPSFAETYKALEKVEAFFCAHSVSDADRENILSLEKSYFQLRQKSAKKQKTMYDFFVKESGFPD